MTTLFLIIGLILSLTFNVLAFILVRNCLLKISTYESWILEFKFNVLQTLETMRSIDNKGTFATSVNEKGKFELDDEVGQVFKQLLDLIEKLNERTQ